MEVSTRLGGGFRSIESDRVKLTPRRGEARVRRQRQLQLLSVTACAIAGLMSKSAMAASGTWTGATDATWAGSNWSATPVPGSGDTATFNGLGNGHTNIDLGSGITVGNILFNTSGAAAYNIGIGAVGSQSLTINDGGSITLNSTVAQNELFDSGIVLGVNSSAAAYSVTNNNPNYNLGFLGNFTGGPAGGTAGTKTLTVGGVGNTTISGSLINGAANETIALTKVGSGTLTFNGNVNAATGLNSNGAYGAVTVNSGTLALDFSNFNAAGNANLLNPYSNLSFGGGTLQIIGNGANASVQSFANSSNGTTVNPGLNVLSVSNNATLNLGAFTQYTGSQTVFNGPTYYNSATGATAVSVPATGTITTTTLGLQTNLLWPSTRSAIATVGLYNWASVVTSGAGAHSILSGDQVSGFYTQVATGASVSAADSNYDLLGSASAASATPWYCDTMRFNVPGAFTFTTDAAGSGSTHLALFGGILVTPNVGPNNTTIANGGTYIVGAYTSAGNDPIDVYQNNTAGELLINVPFYYYSATTRLTCYVKGGAGTVNLTGQGTNDGNYGSAYLNGGTTVINDNSQLGRVASNTTLFLNGGTLLGQAASLSLGTRPVSLAGNGGGLASAAGDSMTVGGLITGIAGTGPLVIGIPASSANANTAGLLPGTGANTANPTGVYATGVVILSNTNSYTGGTTVLGGATLNINGINALGGSNYGGLTLNGGTLQYAPGFINGSGDLTSVGTAGVTIAAGGGTIDTTTNNVTYTGSIGNSGPGLLAVMSNVGTGSLTLASPSTYTGGTLISSGKLNVTNTTGSATGTGAVNVSGGTLAGNGIITGPVTLNSGAIAPGPTGNLNLSTNSLTYNGGSLNFSLNGTAGTASQILAGSVSFFATPTLGPLSITGASSIHPGEQFTVLTSSNTISGGSFLTGVATQSIGRFTVTPSEVNSKSIVLTISGTPGSLIWAGGVSGLSGTISGDGSTWNDTQNPTISGNWNNSGAADYFYDLDYVKFLDTGSPTHTVNLTTTVSPSSVTVTTGSTYTFQGSGSIAGGGNLLVTAGTLNLNTASNTYSGGTNISAGATIVTGAAGALPATGTVIVAGTLDLNGNSQTIGQLSDGGVSTGIVQSSNGTGILTVNPVGTMTFGGLLQNGSGTLGLTVAGTGTQILTNSNSYTGGTTINVNSTLQIGKNTGLLALPSASLVTDNGSLVFNLSSGTYTVSNSISGTGSLTQSGAAGSITGGNVLQLSNNTYSGGTIINSGTIQLTGATGVGTGDVTIASAAYLDLNSNSPTIGAINGAGTIDSSSGGTMTLTVGNNNDTGTFSGSINNSNGTVSLVKAGTGTQTLSGTSNYTGTTTTTGGTLNITGRVGTLATPASDLVSQIGGTTIVNGGSFYGANLYTVVSASSANTAPSQFILTGGGTVNLTGLLNADATTGGDSTGLISLQSGTLTANSALIGRSSNAGLVTAPETVGVTSDGIYITGATLNITTTLAVGTNGGGSSDFRMDGGVVNVGGLTTVSIGNGARFSVLDVNGGTFNASGGIMLGDTNSALNAELVVGGGTLNVSTITLGGTGQNGGTDYFWPIGGTTYIGSGGIVAGSGSATLNITLGNASVSSQPIVAASAPWSSTLPMTLTNSSTGLSPIIQAANSSGGAVNITLSGTLAGTGGLIKTGTGYLALAGGTSYTGPTTVSAGALVDVNNNVLSKSSAVNINGSMIIQNNPSLQNVTQEVAGGYNGGAWNGSSSSAGIPITSSVAASDTTHLRVLGVIQNDNGSGTQLYTTFEGYSSLNDSDVLVKLTYYGDTNLDGKVDGSDYSRIDNAYLYNQTNPGSPLTGWFNGDFNYDGVINGSDYTLMDNAFNTQGALIASEIASPNAVATDLIAGAGSSAVPEPTTLGLLGIGAAGLLGRRRRHR
jgi:autotransporter-associated beta strand protein